MIALHQARYLLLWILTGLSDAAMAQVVRGELADSLTENTIAGAQVYLLSATEETLDSTRTDPQGLFQFRTSPGTYRLRANAAQYTIATFPPFSLADNDVIQFRLLLPIRAVPGSTGIAGVVASASGNPIANATVTISTSEVPLVTDGTGLFRALNLPPGSTSVTVRAIGFEGRIVDLVLSADEVVTLPVETFVLFPLVTELEPIVVEGAAGRTRRPLTEFWQRRAQVHGHFITRSEFLEEGNPQTATDVLQRMGILADRRGLVLRRTASRGGFQSSGQCPPLIFLDGRFLGRANRVGNIDVVVPLADLEAVEAYTSSASLPLEFSRTGATCGVIVFWTR